MKLKLAKLTPCLAALGLTLATMGAAPRQARADFALEVPLFGGPSWAGTNNTITAYYKIWGSGTWHSMGSKSLPNPSYQYGFGYTGSYRADDVAAIKVTTNGPDMLWIDNLQLNYWDDPDPNKYGTAYQWGRTSDGIGYCFSSAASDDGNGWCWNASAYSSITFGY